MAAPGRCTDGRAAGAGAGGVIVAAFLVSVAVLLMLLRWCWCGRLGEKELAAREAKHRLVRGRANTETMKY